MDVHKEFTPLGSLNDGDPDNTDNHKNQHKKPEKDGQKVYIGKYTIITLCKSVYIRCSTKELGSQFNGYWYLMSTGTDPYVETFIL